MEKPDPSTCYRVNEAKAALSAEKQGALPRPVRRATTPGDDFIDGLDGAWDHKSLNPSLSADDAAADIIRRAATGENILADLTSMNPGKAAIIRAKVLAWLPGKSGVGEIAFVPKGPSSATVGGGIVGKRISEEVSEKGTSNEKKARQ